MPNVEEVIHICVLQSHLCLRREVGILMNTWDRISRFEERVRDWIFGPVVKLFPNWVTPNHITSLRIILVIIAIILFLLDYPLNVQVWVLVAGALTDTVDGILAREREQKTRFGAYLDHACDWLLGLWTGILTLKHGLLPIPFIVLIVTFEIGVIILDRIRASRIAEENTSKRILTITMGPANFQPSMFARFQFSTILFGFFSLLLSNIRDSFIFRRLGFVSLYTAVCLGVINLIETFMKLQKERQDTYTQNTTKSL